MKKKRIKKRIKYTLLGSVLCIGLLFLCVCSFFNQKNSSKEDTIPSSFKQEALHGLGYSEEDIALLEKYVSEENINTIIKQVYSRDIVMPYIKEDYYIDDYLLKYIVYGFEHSSAPIEIVRMINTHTDQEFYTDTMQADASLGKFILLNKYYGTDASYKGENLVDVEPKYSLYGSTYETKLSASCYQAFIEMYTQAKKEGFDFRINSSYRSYEKQEKIYSNYVKSDGEALADTYSARPGYSEHQTGFAFDLRDYPLTTDDFSKTKEFLWMQDNAYKYGFILRFPKEKESITGYQYESWHYRYCGIECSTYIHEHDITFEEYYEYFIKFNNPKHLS